VGARRSGLSVVLIYCVQAEQGADEKLLLKLGNTVEIYLLSKYISVEVSGLKN
jgi:hypothetical protein